jgi:uncharacterized membrane protein YdjX (TVP38/TMEM64 family)
VLFGLFYVALTVSLLPGTPISLAAGAVFGAAGGTALISASTATSAAVSFLIAHHLAHDRVARKVGQYPKLRALYQALGRKESWKIVAAIRLSHAMPFGLQNLLLGVTPIRFWPYLLATWVSTLPGIFLFVYLGDLGARALEAGEGGPTATPSGWLVRGLGLLAAVTAVLYVGHVGRKAIKDEIDIDLKGTGPLKQPLRADQPAPAWATLTLLLASISLLAASVWTYHVRDSIRQHVESWFVTAADGR